jgi:hypothetical protein
MEDSHSRRDFLALVTAVVVGAKAPATAVETQPAIDLEVVKYWHAPYWAGYDRLISTYDSGLEFASVSLPVHEHESDPLRRYAPLPSVPFES